MKGAKGGKGGKGGKGAAAAAAAAGNVQLSKKQQEMLEATLKQESATRKSVQAVRKNYCLFVCISVYLSVCVCLSGLVCLCLSVCLFLCVYKYGGKHPVLNV